MGKLRITIKGKETLPPPIQWSNTIWLTEEIKAFGEQCAQKLLTRLPDMVTEGIEEQQILLDKTETVAALNVDLDFF